MAEQKQEQVNQTQQPLAVSARELSAMLGVSLRQIWRLNATGRLPKPIRLGGSVKWRRSEILAWLGQNCPARAAWEAMKESGQRKP